METVCFLDAIEDTEDSFCPPTIHDLIINTKSSFPQNVTTQCDVSNYGEAHDDISEIHFVAGNSSVNHSFVLKIAALYCSCVPLPRFVSDDDDLNH